MDQKLIHGGESMWECSRSKGGRNTRGMDKRFSHGVTDCSMRLRENDSWHDCVMLGRVGHDVSFSV